MLVNVSSPPDRPPREETPLSSSVSDCLFCVIRSTVQTSRSDRPFSTSATWSSLQLCWFWAWTHCSVPGSDDLTQHLGDTAQRNRPVSLMYRDDRRKQEVRGHGDVPDSLRRWSECMCSNLNWLHNMQTAMCQTSGWSGVRQPHTSWSNVCKVRDQREPAFDKVKYHHE